MNSIVDTTARQYTLSQSHLGLTGVVLSRRRDTVTNFKTPVYFGLGSYTKKRVNQCEEVIF